MSEHDPTDAEIISLLQQLQGTDNRKEAYDELQRYRA
jgi:hypothetical protein